MFSLKKQALVVSVLAFASGAFATPVTSFVQANVETLGVVPSELVSARNTFLSGFNQIDSYGFEDKFNGDTASAVGAINFSGGTAGTIKATLAGDGQVRNVNIGGRYNTTPGGTNYWQAKAGGSSSGNLAGTFSLSFDKGISAFSFYGSDIGDFEGAMQIILTPTNGGPNVTLSLGNAISAVSGNMLFFGFTDTDVSYSRITFLTLGSSTSSDFFGFDDFTIADKSQLVTPGTAPEPGSVALVGLALAAAGLSRRKRQAV